MAGIGGVVVQFRADADKAIRETRKLARSLKDIDSNASTASKGMQGLSKISKFGIAAAGAGVAAAGVGIAALGTKMVMLAADFEESQNILQSSLGATADEMAKLNDLAKELGKSTIFSAQEASDAMIELAKAGLSTAEIMDGAVAAAMDLAATEGMGLAEASTILAQTMAQFSIPAKRAVKIVDILAAGATASTTSVEGLSAGLKYVGASAKGLRIPLKDTVTALAALNNKGLDSTTAGTALNRMLLAIASPTSKAADAMEEYGLKLVDAAGEMKPMNDVIGILDEKLGRLSSTERADVLKRIFAVEGGRAASLLMQTGVKDFDALATAVGKAGVAQQMADARTKGLKGALEKLGGAAETIGIQVGERLLPVLTGWITNFTDFLDTPRGTAMIDGLATSVEDAVNNIRDYVEDTLVPAIQKVYDYFASPDGQAQIKSWGDAFLGAADAVGALIGTLDTLFTLIDKLPSNWILQKLGLIPKLSDLTSGGEGQPTVTRDQVRAGALATAKKDRATKNWQNEPRGVTVIINNPKAEKALDSAALALRLERNLR